MLLDAERHISSISQNHENSNNTNTRIDSYLDPACFVRSESKFISHPEELALNGSEGSMLAWPRQL